MPSALRVLQDHTVLQCRSLDRLYLNAYIPELQRPELVEADHYAVWRRLLVEVQDAPFFSSKSGSLDCFQVLVRW